MEHNPSPYVTPSSSTHALMLGVAHCYGDPMYTGDPRGDSIIRRVSFNDLPETVTRWIALGRTINAIHPDRA